jgi:hypothetical protein
VAKGKGLLQYIFDVPFNLTLIVRISNS